MTYRGRVKNGVIVLDPPATLPEGAEVEVVSCRQEANGLEGVSDAEPKSLYDALKDVIGTVEGFPDDTSENLDHYMYGTPKE